MTSRSQHLAHLRGMRHQFSTLIGQGVGSRDQRLTMSKRHDALDWAIDELTKDET